MMYIQEKSLSRLFWMLSKFRVVNVDGLCEMSFFSRIHLRYKRHHHRQRRRWPAKSVCY